MSGAQMNIRDIVLSNGEYIGNTTDGHLDISGSIAVTGQVRGTDEYAAMLWLDDGGNKDLLLIGSMTGTSDDKTYGLYAELNRPSTSDATGDSLDALIKGVYCNHGQNDASFIARGLDILVSNRAGGTLNMLDNNIASSNRVSATAPTVKGLTITSENYGVTATEFGGADIVLKNEGAAATTEYGLRIRNLNNSVASAVGNAIVISDAGANTGYTNGINIGTTIGQAQIVLSNGSKIFSGAAANGDAVYAEVGAYDAVGSMYFSSAANSVYIQVANAGAATDWFKITVTDAD
jgi:hypothetical protein